MRWGWVGSAVSVSLMLACSGGGTGRSAAGALGDFQTDATAVRQETTAHGQAIAAATSVAQVSTIESEYAGAMDDRFASMNGAMDDMMGECGSFAMGDLDGMFVDLQNVCAEHTGVMTSAGTMGAAQNEETHHQQTMQATLNSMGTMTQSMMPMMGDCSGGSMGGNGM